MFLTESQARERLSSEKNLANRFSKDSKTEIITQAEVITEVQNTVTEKVIPLSGKNRNNLTKEERTSIAIRTRSGESQEQVARDLGLDTLTVHNIHKGKVKGINEAEVEEVIDSVKARALNRLMSSLGLITDDKLSGCSAKDLSVIASNMGRVVEKIQTREVQPDNINFIIYAPELKQERAFETVEI